MDIPLNVLQGLACLKPKQQIVIKEEVSQFTEYKEPCPIGCDSSKTQLLISKPGRRMRGNFVNVYHRGSNRLKKEVPFEVKQAAFWREFDELSERSSKRSGSNRKTHTGSVQRQTSPLW